MFLVCLALLERVVWQGKFDLGTRWGHAKRLSFEAAVWTHMNSKFQS